MNKISLKALRQLRKDIQEHLKDGLSCFVTTYGLDELTRRPVTKLSTLDFYSHKKDSNWNYILVIGYFTPEDKLPK